LDKKWWKYEFNGRGKGCWQEDRMMNFDWNLMKFSVGMVDKCNFEYINIRICKKKGNFVEKSDIECEGAEEMDGLRDGRFWHLQAQRESRNVVEWNIEYNRP
jgi:hypothetical protein